MSFVIYYLRRKYFSQNLLIYIILINFDAHTFTLLVIINTMTFYFIMCL